MTSLATAVACFGLLTVGLVGLFVPYPRPALASKPEEIQAEFLKVELTSDPVAQIEGAVPDWSPSKTVESPPSVPALPTVARPNPAIAFALPVEGPVRVVDAAEDAPSRATERDAAGEAGPPGRAVQNLAWGRGDGKQPAPEYPHRAVVEGQEGAVKVRFSVAENGRVVTAKAVEPSPWPLLNESALRTIRDRWRFGPGPERLFEVAIFFKLRD